MKAKNYSRKREAILDKIRSTTCHPTADWVFQALRNEYPNLSLGTVYRNLVLFKEEGSIISVATVDGQERFDGYIEHHGHFICRKCGTVTDVYLPADQPEFAAHVKRAQSCRVDKVDCIAYGTCAVCLEAD